MNAYPDTENTMITPPPAPQKQWLVAYVKSCMEKKTAERLTAMGIEHYLPVQTVERRWSDRVKRMEKLVLPLMIFVHVTPKERPLPLTLSAVSRYMVLRGQHTPAVIPDQQMERFRFMLDYSPEAVKFSASSLSPGDPIRVIKGPPHRSGGRTGQPERQTSGCHPHRPSGMCPRGDSGRLCRKNSRLTINNLPLSSVYSDNSSYLCGRKDLSGKKEMKCHTSGKVFYATRIHIKNEA